MYNAKGLIEFHSRAHKSLMKMMDHCHRFDVKELSNELTGFGFPSLVLQLHHLIGAEKYWIGVLQGRIDVDENISKYSTIEKLDEYRREVYLATEQYLQTASEEELNTARPMMTWGNKEKVLIPAQVIMRTLTHIYHHLGQIAAMSRLMGKPIEPGMDYPITCEY